MAKFQLGEIAIVAISNLPDFPVGMEVEILEVYDPPLRFWDDQDYQYTIYNDGWRVVWANDKSLRKKKEPPQEGFGSWNEIEKMTGWNPLKERIPLMSSPLDDFNRFFENPFAERAG